MGDGARPELPHDAILEGLLKGLDGKLEVVGRIEAKMPDDVKAKHQKAGGLGMMMAEAQPWFGVNELNKELEPYKGKYDILVCLTMLPGVEEFMGAGFVPFTEISAVKDKDVTLAIADGGIRKFGDSLLQKKIVAAVSYRQDMKDEDYDRSPGKDLDEAFGIRFVLITPQNADRHAGYFAR